MSDYNFPSSSPEFIASIDWKLVAEDLYGQLRVARYGESEIGYPVGGALDAWVAANHGRFALAKREAVAVPEHINECAKPDAWNRGYGAGWNDCIDRVRKLNAAASQQAAKGEGA